MNGKPLDILLVEDNPDHAELVKRSLESHRIANIIYHVEDGEAALDFLFNRQGSPNEKVMPSLILLDLRLPKIDGLQVLKEIKKSDKYMRIPVVILTSSEAEKDVAQAYDYHANSYLVKPLDYNNFMDLMNELGFYWLAWNVKPF